MFRPCNANLSVSLALGQVQTALENPTRYHVIQKQKNQVRQYLSESFQSRDGNWANLSAPTGKAMPFKFVSTDTVPRLKSLEIPIKPLPSCSPGIIAWRWKVLLSGLNRCLVPVARLEARLE